LERETLRQVAIRAALGDELMGAMQTLREATDALTRWPWSPFLRRNRLRHHAALEEVMALQVNRVMSTSAATLTALERRIARMEADWR
jgi:hypothetical protein